MFCLKNGQSLVVYWGLKDDQMMMGWHSLGEVMRSSTQTRLCLRRTEYSRVLLCGLRHSLAMSLSVKPMYYVTEHTHTLDRRCRLMTVYPWFVVKDFPRVVGYWYCGGPAFLNDLLRRASLGPSSVRSVSDTPPPTGPLVTRSEGN